MENVLVVGVNTRSVACSLKKLGYNIYSADYFGTCDLQNCVTEYKSISKQKAYQSCGYLSENLNTGCLDELAKDFVDTVDFIICLAGASPENYPKKKIIGNKNVEDVKNKYKLYKRLKNDFKLPKTFSEDKKLIPEILDLGCGYGIIGISIKKHYPQLNMTMIDINDRAIQLSKKNCDENDAECLVIKSNIFANPVLDDKRFDIILTNPPFSAGKKVCIEFIEQSFKHLNPEGILEVVAPHNKGGESLKKAMQDTFGNVEELVKKRGYRVYVSTKE